MNIWAIKEPEVRCDEHPQCDYLEFQTHIFSFLKVFGLLASIIACFLQTNISTRHNSGWRYEIQF